MPISMGIIGIRLVENVPFLLDSMNVFVVTFYIAKICYCVDILVQTNKCCILGVPNHYKSIIICILMHKTITTQREYAA